MSVIGGVVDIFSQEFVTFSHDFSKDRNLLCTYFRRIDTEGQGKISKKDLRMVIPGKQLVQEILRETDLNADGFISFEEFETMMRRSFRENGNNAGVA